MARVLLTGGAGFIGSHATYELLEKGHTVIVLDNYANSSPVVIDRIRQLVGADASKNLSSFECDIRSKESLLDVFARATSCGNIDAVIHLAGLKSVPDSVSNPLCYWETNVGGTSNLLFAMRHFECKTLVFSSSCTVYGLTELDLINELAPINPVHPYGNSKAVAEKILNDIAASEGDWRIACLRYFNPVGAHPSGKIGEYPTGRSCNLFPLISRVAAGQLTQLQIFGNDWPTRDGFCVRDFIHVCDLAQGHIDALQKLLDEAPQVLTINLGTGVGYSVMEIIKTFERVTGQAIPYNITERRPGDAASTVADIVKAKALLDWTCSRNLTDMCVDTWRWQLKNPNGYS